MVFKPLSPLLRTRTLQPIPILSRFAALYRVTVALQEYFSVWGQGMRAFVEMSVVHERDDK